MTNNLEPGSPAANPDPHPRPNDGSARLVMVLGITVPIAVSIGIALGMFVLADPPPAPAPVASAKPAEPEPEPSAKPPATLTEKAASGDYEATKQLREKPPAERSTDETLSLAEGRSVQKRLALEGFAAELAKKPTLLDDGEQLTRLRDFLEDRETTNQAARVIASLPGHLGADILYETWIGTKGKNETTQLCEDLVYSKEVRAKASPALQIALDMRASEACEEFLGLLPRVHEHGDRRSLHLLGRLMRKRGCGDNKLADCYECLRPLDDDDEKIGVIDAIKAVRGRKKPKL